MRVELFFLATRKPSKKNLEASAVHEPGRWLSCEMFLAVHVDVVLFSGVCAVALGANVTCQLIKKLMTWHATLLHPSPPSDLTLGLQIGAPALKNKLACVQETVLNRSRSILTDVFARADSSLDRRACRGNSTGNFSAAVRRGSNSCTSRIRSYFFDRNSHNATTNWSDGRKRESVMHARRR